MRFNDSMINVIGNYNEESVIANILKEAKRNVQIFNSKLEFFEAK